MAKRAKINLSLNVRKSMAIALGWWLKKYQVRDGWRYYITNPKGVPYCKGVPVNPVGYSLYQLEPRETEDEAWADLPEDI